MKKYLLIVFAFTSYACIASESSKYEEPCSEWVTAHALPGTSAVLLHRLVTQCVNTQEYDEKQAKKKERAASSQEELRQRHDLALQIFELENITPKELAANCESKAGKEITLEDIITVRNCLLNYQK